ncbi:MAG TPA: methylaspartate ammonia-lyase [Burkholderiales bacterium]|nr:methylaspartate ammonia-lyase [Burkholderiales bacterium]
MTIDIADVRLTPGISGFWIQDQPAVQTGARKDGFFYDGAPVTPGFRAIKEPSYAYCVELDLADGSIAYGDCVTVVNIGFADRPPPLRHEDLPQVRKVLRSALAGKHFASFRSAAASLEALPLPAEASLPVAYGVSQALLDAAARTSRKTMTEVLRAEFEIEGSFELPGFAAACGGDWYGNVDKAIARRCAMFPHCAIQRKEEVDRLPEYVTWMLGRLAKYGSADYVPDIHIDFHSMLGRSNGNDLDATYDLLARLAERAAPYRVYFEDPLLAESAAHARENFHILRRRFDAGGLTCRLIADEWANSPGQVAEFASDRAAHSIQIKMPDNGNLLNTIDAVRACKRHDVLPYLGGSCNETDLSARVSVHVALALGVWRMLAKPGKGIDEGLMIMTNELARTCGRLGIAGPHAERAS